MRKLELKFERLTVRWNDVNEPLGEHCEHFLPNPRDIRLPFEPNLSYIFSQNNSFDVLIIISPQVGKNLTPGFW